MSEFEYIIGFHTIVLGLATGRLLATLADIIKYRATLGHFWVHTLWCVILQFMLVGWWYSLWRVLNDVQSIGYLEFMLGFSSTVSLYLAASLLHPGIEEDHELDLQAYFFAIRVPLFLCLGFPLLVGTVEAVFLGGGMAESPTPLLDGLSGAEFLLMVIGGLALRSRRGQAAVVLLHSAFYLVFESFQIGIGA